MKQLKEQQVELYVYSTTSAENQEHVEKFPGAFNGLTYSFPAYEREERYLDFVKRFEDVYGEDGTKGPAFVNTHNAMMILFEALKTQPTDGVALRDALMTVIAEGIGTENLYFNDNGQIGEVGFSMKQIQDDQFVELE